MNLVEIQTGDTVTFTVPSGHDLHRMAGLGEYGACDFSGATTEIPPGNVEALTFDTPGVYYYACSVGDGSHCSGGNMKITIVVSEAVPSTHPAYLALALAVSGLAASGLFVRGRSGLRPSRS